MRQEAFDLTARKPGTADEAIGALLGIAEAMDARFLPVGEAMLALVVSVDSIIAGLGDIRTAFTGEETSAAITELLKATQSLSETPVRQERRRTCLAELGGTLRTLNDLRGELDRVLFMLQFYSLNVKIAAGGAAEFVDFADEMHAQLGQGRAQLDGVADATRQLRHQLAGMGELDAKLDAECRKLIPKVPEQLAEAAAALRTQQSRVAEVVGVAERGAAGIRTGIGAALGAIQIGDSARQRIEHVAFACELMAPLRLDVSEVEREAFGHMAALCLAQIEAISEEFTADAARLLATLEQLQPETVRLLETVRNDQSVTASKALIARLEAGIGESMVLTGHLQQADIELAGILSVIVSTIADLAIRIERVRDLGIEVGYMSVNANLRCRRDRAISEPVSVIAREIKAHSQLIDAMCSEFLDMSNALSEVSMRISSLESNDGIDVRAALSASLAALEEVAARNMQGLSKVSIDCDGLADRLAATAQSLRDSMAVAQGLETVCVGLRLHAQQIETDVPGFAEHPLAALLDRAHSVYTMAQERKVHARFAPAASAVADVPVVSARTVDDDDALF